MNFHNSTQVYIRPAAKLPLRQHFGNNEILSLQARIKTLLKGTGKAILISAAIVVVINLATLSAIRSLDSSLVSLEHTRHELLDTNIGHRAIKAQISNPVNLHKLAQEKLSLIAADKERVGVFDQKRGTFRQGTFDMKTKTFVYL